MATSEDMCEDAPATARAENRADAVLPAEASLKRTTTETTAAESEDEGQDEDGESLHDLLRPSTGLSDYRGPIAWDEVLRRLSSHPHEAAEDRAAYGYMGGRRRNALQLSLTSSVAARGDEGVVPGEVVRELIRAYPEAVFTTDEMGYTPLYLACVHRAGLGAMRELLRAPDVVAVNRRRRCSSSDFSYDSAASTTVAGTTITSSERSSFLSQVSTFSSEDMLKKEVDDKKVEAQDDQDEDHFRRTWAVSQASASEPHYRETPLDAAPTSAAAGLILEAHPEAVFHESLLGRMPLHRARPLHRAVCSASAGPEMVRVLVQAGRRAGEAAAEGGPSPSKEDQNCASSQEQDCQQDHRERVAWRHHGGVLAEDSLGKSPFEYACEKLVHHLPAASPNGNGDEAKAQLSPPPLSDEGELLWSKLLVMAREVAPSRCPESGEPLLVHSLLYLGAPAPVIRYSLNRCLHPCCAVGVLPSAPSTPSRESMLLRVVDRNGMTPLAIACANPNTSPDVFYFLLHHPVRGCPEAAAMRDDRGWFPLHHLAGSASKGRGRSRLLALSNDARQGNGEDASEAWTTGDIIEAVLKAHPEALATKQAPDGDGMMMAPFMVAAMGGTGRSPDDTNTARSDGDSTAMLSVVYALLREDPSVVMSAT